MPCGSAIVVESRGREGDHRKGPGRVAPAAAAWSRYRRCRACRSISTASKAGPVRSSIASASRPWRASPRRRDPPAHSDQLVDLVVFSGELSRRRVRRRRQFVRPGRGLQALASTSGISAQNTLPARRELAPSAAHQRHELPAYRQAQPGAPMAAGGRTVRLREQPENILKPRRECRCRCLHLDPQPPRAGNRETLRCGRSGEPPRSTGSCPPRSAVARDRRGQARTEASTRVASTSPFADAGTVGVQPSQFTGGRSPSPPASGPASIFENRGCR
jgi:hypothetical protein